MLVDRTANRLRQANAQRLKRQQACVSRPSGPCRVFDHGQDGRHGNDVAFVFVHFNPIADNAFGQVFRFSALWAIFSTTVGLTPIVVPGYGLGEAAFIEAVIQQNWSFPRFNKQSCSLAEDVVAMRHAPPNIVSSKLVSSTCA